MQYYLHTDINLHTHESVYLTRPLARPSVKNQIIITCFTEYDQIKCQDKCVYNNFTVSDFEINVVFYM